MDILIPIVTGIIVLIIYEKLLKSLSIPMYFKNFRLNKNNIFAYFKFAKEISNLDYLFYPLGMRKNIPMMDYLYIQLVHKLLKDNKVKKVIFFPTYDLSAVSQNKINFIEFSQTIKGILSDYIDKIEIINIMNNANLNFFDIQKNKELLEQLKYIDSKSFSNKIKDFIGIRIKNLDSFNKHHPNKLVALFDHVIRGFMIVDYIDNNLLKNNMNISFLLWETEFDKLGLYLGLKARTKKNEINIHPILGKTIYYKFPKVIPTMKPKETIYMYDDYNNLEQKIIKKSRKENKKYSEIIKIILKDIYNIEITKNFLENIVSSEKKDMISKANQHTKFSKLKYQNIGLIKYLQNINKQKNNLTTKIITDTYYKGSFFLFLHELCNANCYFCYLDPSKVKNIDLNKNILLNIDTLFKSLKVNHFREIRISGGEPLIYSNFSEIIALVNKYQFEYTLLTNGIELKNNIQLLTMNKPKKITISFHTIQNTKEIYQIEDYKSDDIIKNIKLLILERINITISILVLEENFEEITDIITMFHGIGVKEFKIIYPNHENINDSRINHFQLIKRNIQKLKFSDTIFRYSCIEKSPCQLNKRGFISGYLSGNNIKLSKCCLSKNLISDINLKTLEQVIHDMYNETPEECNYYYGSCPLTLVN